ncbi:MAG: hypothetical protein R3F35_22605 [Myxococcota bacterium]
MSPAEIILRIGASLGALLILAAHALTIGALMRVDCDSVSDANWAGTSLLGITTLLAMGLAGLALPWRRRARAAAVLALLLAALLVGSVARPVLDTTVSGARLCSSAPLGDGSARNPAPEAPHPGRTPRASVASRFERAWPLLQLAVALAAALQAIRYLRAPRSAARVEMP